MLQRINKIYPLIRKQNLDSLLVTSSANISYLTGYISRDSYLIVSPKKNIYITDSRYTEEANARLGKPFFISQADGTVFEQIAELCGKFGFKNLGFEKRHISFYGYQRLKQGLGAVSGLIPVENIVEDLRQIKTDEELRKIREAVRITTTAFDFIKKFISPGIREIEIVGELQRFIRYEGGLNTSFDIIVASGPNSSFPHHLSGNRKIERDEPVLIDMGVDYEGYKSDLTRVFFSGKISQLVGKIYDIVLTAQKRALAKIRPKVKVNGIDFAARQYITQKGYGGFFGHNLGHGVGLEVHEAPNISPKANNELKEGCVFTLEPAIYLPGKFGIRIEDMVLATGKKMEVISGALDK